MKRNFLAIFFLLFAFFCAYGQNSNPIDLILLLDTSSGMSSSNEKVNEYLTGKFLSEFLRIGDTFHLIAYSGAARLDAARRIQSRGDVETIVGRILLQYPVENGNDVRAAITYTEQYAASLPQRPKKIVMVGTGSSDTNSLITAARQRLNSRNATIDFVQVTSGQSLANLPASGRPPRAAPQRPAAAPARTPTSTAAQTPPASTTTTPSSSTTSTAPAASTTPPASTSTTPSTSTPSSPTAPAAATAPPASTAPAATSTAPASSSTTAAAPAASTSTASSSPTAPAASTAPPASTAAPSASGGGDASPASDKKADEKQTADKSGSSAPAVPEKAKEPGQSLVSSLPLIIGLIILALIILLLIIIFASRRLGSSPNRVIASASSYKREKEKEKFVNHSKDLAGFASTRPARRDTPYESHPAKQENVKPPEINPSGPLLLNLFVEDQNTAIGKRNIHSLKSGYSLSVGGGKGDDFYIFLVPMPPKIGEIRRDGSQCSFVPYKPKYFPDIGSNEVKDCINKTIRIISDKNYEIRFRFEMYEDPLIALNRILTSVNVPG